MKHRVGVFISLLLVFSLGSCGDAPEPAIADATVLPRAEPTAPAATMATPPAVAVAVTFAPSPVPSETALSPGPSPTAAPSDDPTPTAPPVTPDPTEPTEQPDPPSEQERLEAGAVELTNAERAQAGCPDVAVDDRLTLAARAHSEDMAERDFFDHTDPDGVGPWDRASAAGYDWLASENIAWGHRTAEAVVEGWMDSPGHRRNILDCDAVAVGIGVADSPSGPYWTQMFGRR